MPMTSRKVDRRLNILLTCSLVLVVGVALFAMFALPAILNSSSNSDQLNRSNDLNSCRSELSADVTNARTALDDARTDLELQSNIGLQGVAEKDTAKLQDAIAQSVLIRKRIDETRAHLLQANQTFQVGITESRQHPDDFLRKCKAND